MFKTRLISGIFLVIAALLTIISGGYVLFVTLLCVSLLGIQELYKAMEVHKDGIGLLEMAGYLGAVLYYASLLLDFERYGMMAVLLGLVLLMFVYVFTYPKYEADQVMSAFFGIVYFISDAGERPPSKEWLCYAALFSWNLRDSRNF